MVAFDQFQPVNSGCYTHTILNKLYTNNTIDTETSDNFGENKTSIIINEIDDKVIVERIKETFPSTPPTGIVLHVLPLVGATLVLN